MLSMLNIWSMDKGKGAPSFYRTIKGYLDAGWNLTIILPERSAQFVQELDGAKIITYKSIFEPLVKIPKIGFCFSLLNIYYAEKMLYFLGNRVLKNNQSNTVIYSYEVHGVKAGKKLSTKYKVPFVSRFQGTVLAPVKNTFINRLIRYPHFSALKTEADSIIMTNDGTFGDKVLKRLGNSTEKVYFWKNGVDVSSYSNEIDSNEILTLKNSLGIGEGDKVLLTVSRLAHWKKVDRAIVALKNLIQEVPECKLIIVGDGDERVRLQQLSEDLGLKDKVIFAGAVSHSDVVRFMTLADVFLSLYDLSNVGNPLLEAMLCGKPIITLNTGDTASVIRNGDNGILLELENLNELPAFIRKLLSDKSFACRLGEAAKKNAQETLWSWDERINAELTEVNKLF
jgi:glycosyltransferase involved in cell wall biosynthesis